LCTLYHKLDEKEETTEQLKNPHKFVENTANLQSYLEAINLKAEKTPQKKELSSAHSETVKASDFEASS